MLDSDSDVDDFAPIPVHVLSGFLGAGKTTLTQGLGEGLGVRGGITSPTFVIVTAHGADGSSGLM